MHVRRSATTKSCAHKRPLIASQTNTQSRVPRTHTGYTGAAAANLFCGVDFFTRREQFRCRHPGRGCPGPRRHHFVAGFHPEGTQRRTHGEALAQREDRPARHSEHTRRTSSSNTSRNRNDIAQREDRPARHSEHTRRTSSSTTSTNRNDIAQHNTHRAACRTFPTTVLIACTCVAPVVSQQQLVHILVVHSLGTQ